MSLSSARPGIVGHLWLSDRPFLTVEKLYDAVRTQIPHEPGLIHGSLTSNVLSGNHPEASDPVCALGAALKLFQANGEKFFITAEAATAMEELQEYNDSMPDATPEERKWRVLGFLDAKIAEQNSSTRGD